MRERCWPRARATQLGSPNLPRSQTTVRSPCMAGLAPGRYERSYHSCTAVPHCGPRRSGSVTGYPTRRDFPIRVEVSEALDWNTLVHHVCSTVGTREHVRRGKKVAPELTSQVQHRLVVSPVCLHQDGANATVDPRRPQSRIVASALSNEPSTRVTESWTSAEAPYRLTQTLRTCRRRIVVDVLGREDCAVRHQADRHSRPLRRPCDVRPVGPQTDLAAGKRHGEAALAGQLRHQRHEASVSASPAAHLRLAA